MTSPTARQFTQTLYAARIYVFLLFVSMINISRKAFLVLLLLPIFYDTGFAFTDPYGDVYPEIYVENGNFVVYFGDNTLPRRKVVSSSSLQRSRVIDDRGYEVFKTMVTPEGKIIHRRLPAKLPPLKVPDLPFKVKGFGCSDEIYTINGVPHLYPEDNNYWRSSPYLLAVEPGAISRKSIWMQQGNRTVSQVRNLLVENATIAFTGILNVSRTQEPDPKAPFYFFWQDISELWKDLRGKPIDWVERHTYEVKIGEFGNALLPRKSKLIRYKQDYYVAWEAMVSEGYAVNLTKLNRSGYLKTIKVAKVRSGSSIAIENINNSLLVALSEGGYDVGDKSKIKLIHVDLNLRFNE